MSGEVEQRSEGRPMPGTSGHGTATVDVRERGMPRDGQEQAMDRRLFMQLLCFACPPEVHPHEVVTLLGKALEQNGVAGVVYEDMNHPLGLGLLTMSEDPADFVEKVRPILGEPPFRRLVPRPELTMIGRTYSSGFEQDLEYWLLRRPRETSLNPAWKWAVWYPLRRSGAFEQLSAKDQGGILREHAAIGRAYGEQDLAHDVRLACHGLDQNDNEFVIGLIGKDLHPLSHVVQAMRKTRQTSEYIVQMGPFFVGRMAWRSEGKP
jgi:chlorite dismutase